MLVFFTWVVRGVADTVSMWDAVERVTSFATQVPSELTQAEEVGAVNPWSNFGQALVDLQQQ